MGCRWVNISTLSLVLQKINCIDWSQIGWMNVMWSKLIWPNWHASQAADVLNVQFSVSLPIIWTERFSRVALRRVTNKSERLVVYKLKLLVLASFISKDFDVHSTTELIKTNKQKESMQKKLILFGTKRQFCFILMH